ncbi:MAG: hypothetical protein KIT22_15755, partial [Verrucomicrobiae bacterium]|nr:hypothetical protein [Verrucomicrobiae bacterium]
SVGYESEAPEQVAEFMGNVSAPWIGFKVLGAGRMQARDGFALAFGSGADFINVGMYDFQVKEDIGLVRQVVGEQTKRLRPWIGVA